jgi:hypothetical protein
MQKTECGIRKGFTDIFDLSSGLCRSFEIVTSVQAKACLCPTASSQGGKQGTEFWLRSIDYNITPDTSGFGDPGGAGQPASGDPAGFNDTFYK